MGRFFAWFSETRGFAFLRHFGYPLGFAHFNEGHRVVDFLEVVEALWRPAHKTKPVHVF